MTRGRLAAVALAAALAGCGLDLGPAPYRCGEGDACPDGYECVPSRDGERYCVLPGEAPPGGARGGGGGGGAGGAGG